MCCHGRGDVRATFGVGAFLRDSRRAFVSVSEDFSEKYLKPRSVTPPDRVRVLADDACENTPIVSVATKAQRVGVFGDQRIRFVLVLVFQSEDRSPRFAILRNHLLGGGAAENLSVFAFETAGVSVPHVALKPVFVVLHESLEVGLDR